MHGGSRENFWKTGGKLSQELKMTCHNTTRTDQERKSNLSPTADNDLRFRSWSTSRSVRTNVLYVILPNCHQVSSVFHWICLVAVPQNALSFPARRIAALHSPALWGLVQVYNVVDCRISGIVTRNNIIIRVPENIFGKIFRFLDFH
jgi:hypothetical protein